MQTYYIMQKPRIEGSKDDLFGDDAKQARKRTEEGFAIYTEVSNESPSKHSCRENWSEFLVVDQYCTNVTPARARALGCP